MKKGNFAEKQVKKMTADAEKRLAQILFNSWGIEEAAKKVVDMTAQNKKRMQDIMKMAEEDVSQAKEKPWSG